MGHDVAYAADGRSALAEAGSRPPDVVLLDIGLPDMDGYEVADRLSQCRGPKPPFIIALSGYEYDGRRRGAAGIDLYLVKPVDPADLVSLLGRFRRVSKGILTEVMP
jgi:two-component system CheB/CheR fusion protein